MSSGIPEPLPLSRAESDCECPSSAAHSDKSWAVVDCPSSGGCTSFLSRSNSTASDALPATPAAATATAGPVATGEAPEAPACIPEVENGELFGSDYEYDDDDAPSLQGQDAEEQRARELQRRAARHGSRRQGHANPRDELEERDLLRREQREELRLKQRKARADSKYRVEERRFKRRFRDWCCFRGAADGQQLPPAFAVRPSPAAAAPKAAAAPPKAAVASKAETVKRAAAATAEVLSSSAKATAAAAKAVQRAGRQKVLDACAHVVFWRSTGLLQKIYGHSSSVDLQALQRVAATQLTRRIQAALSQSLPTTASATTARRSRRGHRGGQGRGGPGRHGKESGRPGAEEVTALRTARRRRSRETARRRSAERAAKSIGLEGGSEVPARVAAGQEEEGGNISEVSPSEAEPKSRQAAGTRTVSAEVSGDEASSASGSTSSHESTIEPLAAMPIQPKSSGIPHPPQDSDGAQAAHTSSQDQEPKTGECCADDVNDLVAVWDSLDQLEYRAPDDSLGRVLVPALESGKPLPVGDQSLFLRRFHSRTHDLFKAFDWSNIRAIGGMMLACLVADEEAYETSFAETDVDLYIVGLSGEAFRRRVARAVVDLHSAAEGQGLQVSVLRTPCTITLSLRYRQAPLPNVQIICAPFATTRHLLMTTDIDCTGLALLDGHQLLATQWAVQAVATRQNLARPEKYCIRGEFSTESRLLKYATRGFRVLDVGLPPGLEVCRFQDYVLHDIAMEAATMLLHEALGQLTEGGRMSATVRRLQQRVRQTGMTGAQLLLTAWQLPGLQLLLLFDVPLLPAGMGDRRLLGPAAARATGSDGYAFQRTPGQAAEDTRRENARIFGPKLRLLEARTRGKNREVAMTLEEVVFSAVRELDPEKKSEVRSWYTGLEETHRLRQLEVAAASA